MVTLLRDIFDFKLEEGGHLHVGFLSEQKSVLPLVSMNSAWADLASMSEVCTQRTLKFQHIFKMMNDLVTAYRERSQLKGAKLNDLKFALIQ